MEKILIVEDQLDVQKLLEIILKNEGRQLLLTDRVEAFDAGADDYIGKPFDMLELQKMLKNILPGKFFLCGSKMQ